MNCSSLISVGAKIGRKNLINDDKQRQIRLTNYGSKTADLLIITYH